MIQVLFFPFNFYSSKYKNGIIAYSSSNIYSLRISAKNYSKMLKSSDKAAQRPIIPSLLLKSIYLNSLRDFFFHETLNQIATPSPNSPPPSYPIFWPIYLHAFLALTSPGSGNRVNPDRLREGHSRCRRLRRYNRASSLRRSVVSKRERRGAAEEVALPVTLAAKY